MTPPCSGSLEAVDTSLMKRAASALHPNGGTPYPTEGCPWGSSARYLIERRVGAGGMGVVFAARDVLLERTVALKVLRPETGARAHRRGAERLLVEARLAARIEHDRIARIYDVDEHNGISFFAMEFVKGETLRDAMTARHLTSMDVLGIVMQIAEGLAALHARGVLHGDLKPENVMVSEGKAVKLLDFGLARPLAVDRDRPCGGETGAVEHALPAEPTDSEPASMLAGTPGYIAPERYAGRPMDARADVFALGVIFHELVTRTRPMVAYCKGQWGFASSRPHELWEQQPAALRQVAGFMVTEDPRLRFSDGSSALQALRAACWEQLADRPSVASRVIPS